MYRKTFWVGFVYILFIQTCTQTHARRHTQAHTQPDTNTNSQIYVYFCIKLFSFPSSEQLNKQKRFTKLNAPCHMIVCVCVVCVCVHYRTFIRNQEARKKR